MIVDIARILVLDRTAALADQVRRVVADESAVEVVACTRMADAADMLADGDFTLFVAGPSTVTRTGIARIEVIHDELPELTIVLAFSRRPDAAMRDIVRAGAVDMIQLPADDSVVRDAIVRAVDLGRRHSRQPATVGAGRVAAREPGRVLTLASSTGGCGKTFLATNLAALLAQYTGQTACIIDLDLQFGEVSTALRMRPRYTIVDALQRDSNSSDLETHLPEYLVQHETGFSVLAAPRDPSEADRVDPPDVSRIIAAARSHFDVVIVDTPPYLSETVLAAFDVSDLLFTIATLDLPSVRNLGVFLTTLERLKISSDNIRLILNKAETDVGIEVDQVRRLFPQGFSTVIPYAKEVSRSINLGMPVVVSHPQSPVSRLIVDGFRELIADADHLRLPQSEHAKGLRRWFTRPVPAAAR